MLIKGNMINPSCKRFVGKGIIGILFFLSFFSGSYADEHRIEGDADFKTQEMLLSQANASFDIGDGYDAVGTKFSGDINTIEFSADGGLKWYSFHLNADQKGDSENPLQNFSDLFFLPEISQKFQFRIAKGHQQDKGADPEKIVFFFVNTHNTDSLIADSNYQIPQAAYKRDDNFFLENGIISRQIWGADESFRYESGYVNSAPVINNPPTQKIVRCQKWQTLYPDDFKTSRYVSTENNKKLKWGYRYSPSIKKIIIHHTAENTGSSGDRTSEQIMRGIYAYHAKGRGWGDIGYNFVIAPDGKIFEGRAGGDYVVGGHVYCANVQTIGVSLMGNFQEEEPTEQQIIALKKLIWGLAKKYNIDPSAESMFHGKFTGNVAGHRDYGSTACPGKNLYSILPLIIDQIDLSGLPFQVKKLLKRSAHFLSNNSIFIKTLSAGTKAHYRLQFKNTGQGTWDSSTWLFADLPNTDVSVLPVDGKNSFYAAKLREASVAPGKIGTFDVDIIAGFQNGLQTVEFTPVVNSRRLKSASVVIPVEVQNAEISTVLQKFETTVSADKKYVQATVEIKNTGNTVFLQKEVLLKIRLENTVRFLKMKEQKVGKNQVAHFSGKIPVVGSSNIKLFSMVLANRNGNIHGAKIESRSLVIDPSLVVVTPPTVKAQWSAEVKGLVRKKFKSYSSKGTLPHKQFLIRNTGNQTWTHKNIHLKAIRQGERHILLMQEKTVAPGETATFYLQGKNPLSSHQVFRMELRYKDKNYRINRIRSAKFHWIVLPLEKSSSVTDFSDTVSPSSTIPKRDIRILLSYPHDSVTLFGDFDVMVDGKILGKNSSLLSFHQQGDGLSAGLYAGKIFRIIPQNNSILTVSSWSRPTAWDASLNDNQFRGIIEARVYKGKLILINELPLEDYLKGLAEVSNSAPLEKQKAIAVIARSYAQFYLSSDHRKYPNAPYDGDDSPISFQKYLGYGYEKRSPQFSNAVEKTDGLTVKYNGKTVKTPFFSESSGRTLSAQEVWGWTHTPYLVSVDDTACKNGHGTQHGHGVGLSGCGAETMARQGKSFREILQYYYTGVTIGK